MPRSRFILSWRAPATSAQANFARTGIIPIACWRVDDVRFAFDSSFVKPELAEEMQHLAKLREAHKLEVKPEAGLQSVTAFPRLSVFGHADPTGSDDYNKQLSGRRATAIYAMLVRNTDLWEDLYSHPLSHDDWGLRSVQVMLDHLGFSPGPADGVFKDETRDAIRAFQQQQGLSANGTADKDYSGEAVRSVHGQRLRQELQTESGR